MPIAFLLALLAATPDLSSSPGAAKAIAGSVSGGASLGAYEAGYLYYSAAAAHAAGIEFPIRLMAGTSAGSINTLLEILTVCGDGPSAVPEDSMFWQVWSSLSAQRLFVPDEVTPVSVLSRAPLEHVADLLAPVWEHGLATHCDVVWAVPTTRLHPRSITLAKGSLELPHTEEKFLVRIQGRGFGVRPSARNYVDKRSGWEQSTLVTDHEGEIPYSALKELIFASSAFPAAFSPQNMKYCLGSTGSAVCESGDAVEALFIDGGVLDNAPLRLTVRTLGAGLRPNKNGDLQWIDSPRLDEMLVPDGVSIGFISPDASDYPAYQTDVTQRMPKSLIGLGIDLASGFVAVARSKELSTIVEERPELRQRIFIPRRRLPTYSALLQGFLGFFERDFRTFDFALGMLESDHSLRERIGNSKNAWFKPLVPPTQVNSDGPWPTFQCLQYAMDAPPEIAWDPAPCKSATNNQSILARVALTRLYDHCARLSLAELTETHNTHCGAAAAGFAPPTDLPAALQNAWRRRDDEPHLLFLLRLLAGYGFTFTDLGLSSDDAASADEVVRAQLDAMSQALAKKQPLDARGVVGLATRVAVDALTEQAAAWSGFITLADMIEGGTTWLLPRPRNQTWRLNGAILLDGWSRLLTSDSGNLALGAAFGLEWEPAFVHSALVQGRGILRAGYMLGQGDDFSAHTCVDRSSERLGACSRSIAQVGLGLTVLDNIRLQLLGSWYPPFRQGERSLWSVSPGVGLQY